MRQLPLITALSPLLALGLYACAPAVDQQAAEQAASNAVAGTSAQTQPEAGPVQQDRKVVGLQGLGDLRLGQPVPAQSTWAERGAQINEACRTVSSPDYPGVYSMVIDGKVERITVGQRSDVKLIEGIGVGASEQDVKNLFAGFSVEPHKYEAAPAKYLTAPNAESGTPALRFEIGEDGKVKMIHVGMMPELGYVEGCA